MRRVAERCTSVTDPTSHGSCLFSLIFFKLSSSFCVIFCTS